LSYYYAMPAQTSPPPGAARPLSAPSANGSTPSPPGAAGLRRPRLRTRISGIRIALIAGVLALVVLVIFIAQNAQAVKLGFLGAQVRLPLGAPRGTPAGATPDSIQRSTWEWEGGQGGARSRRADTPAAI
jgi:hypothetical protein